MNLERGDWVSGVMDGWWVPEKTEAHIKHSSEDLSPKVDAVEKSAGTVGPCFHPSSPRNLFIQEIPISTFKTSDFQRVSAE